jgi:hypothetical protein
MPIHWTTPAGDLGTLIEREVIDISIEASTDRGSLTFSVIAGDLPNGLRLEGSQIKGSPTEVARLTTNQFVIRASNGFEIKDRTFSLTVDGGDSPIFITPEGFLNVGSQDAYFVLDNAQVEFQIEARDPDLNAGQVLDYFLVPNAGELPPGLSLSSEGLISGFTDPVFATIINQDGQGYDTQSFDTVPLDIGGVNSNGYDSFFYDNQTFDYNEPSQIPERLSRIYAFTIGITDGFTVEERLFKIYVVTEEFLKADNNILQVDTNLFQADADGNRNPLWITDSNLGRYRAKNYITLFLEVYDPPSLPGITTYLLDEQNPDGSASVIPPGMALDPITGEIAGAVPYQDAVTKEYKFTVIAINFPQTGAPSYNLKGQWQSSTIYQANDAVKFNGNLYIAKKLNRNNPPEEGEFWTLGYSTVSKTFTVEIIGEIESLINWTTPSDRGTLFPNVPSNKFIKAETTAYGGQVNYSLESGSLPPGLTLLPTGIITGKVKQFADDSGKGLTRFFEQDSALDDSTGSRSFTTTFDSNQTTFDRKFSFTVKAKDFAALAETTRTFTITIPVTENRSFANLYLKALQEKQKRLYWADFITNAEIFNPTDLYRYGDPNYSVQTDLRVLVYAGIESQEAVRYVQAMSRNHYRKHLYFGDVKRAIAKDSETQQVIYETVYVELIDELEKDSKKISNEIELRDKINSPVLVSFDAITIDSDIPFVSDADHQRIFPNSIENMRDRIQDLGTTNRDFLPLWMRSIQDAATYELGFTKALVLCYARPGKGQDILNRINASGFDFKQLNFESDRYIIDILDGEISDKYLAFPQTGEKKP